MPPVEVIDLLSSPAAVVPPQRPSKTKAAARPNKAPSARIIDYDMLDLTADDNGCHATTEQSAAPLAASVKRPIGSRNSAREFLFWSSDDLDASVDLFDETFDERPAKKPRSAGPSVVKGAGSSTINRPLQRTHSGPEKSVATSAFTSGPTETVSRGAARGILQPAAFRRWNSTVDPIQTSSDPFASSPRQEREKENEIIDLSLDDDLNPFASSPPSFTDKGKGKGKGKANAPPRARQSGQHTFISPYKSKGTCQQAFPPQAQKALAPSSPLLIESRPVTKMTRQPSQKGAKDKGKNIVAWDNISSSAPEVNLDYDWDMDVQPTRKSLGRSRSDGVDFDLGDPDNFPTESDDDLPDLNDLKPSKSKSRVSNSISKVTKRYADSSSKKSLAEAESAKLDRLAAREAEKRRKQREKDEAKEQRRIDKERAAALAEVNKVRTDKKVSTPEMIVDLSTSMPPSTKLQIEALLSDLNVTSHSYASPVNNVVKWRRKVRARFNDTEGHWEPIPERIEPEKHALVIIAAAEFVELALGAKGTDLEAHVLKMQQTHEKHTLIYLIEGLYGFMRKNTNARNRQFQAAVRSTDDTPPPSTQQRKRRAPKPPPPHIDENIIEDALLSLQVHHNALIHHTSAPIETAQWVATFTQHISTIPYRHQKDTTTASAAFCMDSGQVRTGENAHDTYLRMLQEIARVTAPIAYGIAGEFGTVGDLVRGLENGGPLVLEGVRKSANKDGAFSERCLGQAVSRRVWKVFTGRDENSTDI